MDDNITGPSLGATPPVSPAEEQDLLQQVLVGREAQTQLDTAMPADQPGMQAQIEAGLAARSRLIEANIRLVIHVIKRYFKDYPAGMLTFEDLVQEGTIGLARGIDKWRPDKGATKLCTYAIYWIRQAVNRAITNTGATIRLPVYRVAQVTRLRRLSSQLGDNYTIANLAQASGLTVQEIDQLHQWSQSTVSLDAPLGDDDSAQPRTPLDFVTNAPTVETEVAASRLRTRLDEALAQQLTSHEQQVLRLRYGLDDGAHKTLEVVGNCLGVTRERIRQIEKEALQKLRSTRQVQHLSEFLREAA